MTQPVSLGSPSEPEELTRFKSKSKVPSNPRDFFARLYESEPKKDSLVINPCGDKRDSGSPSTEESVVSSGMNPSVLWQNSTLPLVLSGQSHSGNHFQVDPNLLARQLLASSTYGNFQWNLLQQMTSCPDVQLPPALSSFCE